MPTATVHVLPCTTHGVLVDVEIEYRIVLGGQDIKIENVIWAINDKDETVSELDAFVKETGVERDVLVRAVLDHAMGGE